MRAFVSTPLIYSILLLAISNFTFAQEMTFDNNSHNFGVVKEGATAEHKYKFTNTGNANLQIEEVKTTCGCTVAEYPKEVVKPGEKGEIVVNFSTEGKSGAYVKGVNIYFRNGEANLLVYIDVLPKKVSKRELKKRAKARKKEAEKSSDDHKHSPHDGHEH